MPYLPANLPMRGITADSGWASMPQGFTADCMNVLPYDPFRGRLRIGQRSPMAVAYWFEDDNEDGVEIQAILRADAYVSGVLKQRTVIVAGGVVYVVNPGSAAVLCSGQGTVGSLSPTLATTGQIGAAQFKGYVYFCDGAAYKKIDITSATPTVSTWTGPASVVAASANKAKLLVRFGARLAMSGVNTSESNWWLSKVDDAETWTPGSNEGDPQAGSSSTRFGQIGEPIRALIPVGESGLMFATANSLSYLTADPVVDSAQIVSLSRTVGITGPKAWCTGDGQAVYVLAQSGLYRFNPNEFQVTQANRVTFGRLDTYFKAQRFDDLDPVLAYDSERGTVWCFMSRSDGESSTHLAYHEGTDSFWPCRIALPGLYAPKCAGQMPSIGTKPPHVAVGGSAGLLGWFESAIASGVDGILADGYEGVGGCTAPTDSEAEAQVIASRLVLGPLLVDQPGDVMLRDFRVELAADSPQDDSDWTFLTGPYLDVVSAPTAQEALSSDILAVTVDFASTFDAVEPLDIDGGDAAETVFDTDYDGDDAAETSFANQLDGWYAPNLQDARFTTTDTLTTEPTERIYTHGSYRIVYDTDGWYLEYTTGAVKLAKKSTYWWNDPGEDNPAGLYREDEVTLTPDPPIPQTRVPVVAAAFEDQVLTELGELLPGRNDSLRCRIRCGAAYGRLRSTGKPWALARISVMADQVGPHRNVRGTN
jgi:hypothetical protein